MPSPLKSVTVVGIVGHKRAGKTTAAAHLVELHGAHRLRHSAVLEVVLGELCLDPRLRKNCSDLFMALKKPFGENFITRRIIHDISMATSTVSPPFFVIDGIRWPQEVLAYQQAFGTGFRLMSLAASAETRFTRQILDPHSRPGEPKTFKEFLHAEATGGDAGILDVVSMGEVIENDTRDVQNLYAALDAFVARHHVVAR